ncbi:MAG TPA: methyltransferase domain-containing protein [Desulfobulbaceae bacterium]|nr:methyltransferase domain-containing protein [Desulfobulbaceae bacterium]
MLNTRLLSIVFLCIGLFTATGLLRLNIDTDVIHSLPAGEKVISDSLDIFEHHPIHDQIAVDIGINTDNPEILSACGIYLEQEMRASGLFAKVGMDDIGALIPQLAIQVAGNLPLLFSAEELRRDVAPRLEPDRISERLNNLYTQLNSMESIGQARFIRSDPLGLKDLILAKMAPLAPTQGAEFFKGHLLSRDGRHLLVTARPLAGGTDTTSARKISRLLQNAAGRLAKQYADQGIRVTLTPAGAYRAALDNEQIIRHDVNLALLLATLGIGLLLLVSFPRPLLGLLSLVPALAGTSAALFVYSLLHSDISIMVLGFGGAIISITVDHGIGYLLFLDRPHETRGREAAHEIRAIGFMAVITTIGAFLILGFSGFPIFSELGQFTALGVLFSFLFVHTVFPRIFPVMPAAGKRSLPLQKLVNILYKSGKPGAVAAAALALGLLFFAKPQFQVSLSSMNTVSRQTMEEDARFTKTWGNIGSRVYLMNRAGSTSELQSNNDALLAKIDSDIRQNILAGAFVPSMLFPGNDLAERNLSAWHNFWADDRAKQTKKVLLGVGKKLGFTPAAFTDFLTLLEQGYTAAPPPIPARYYKLLSITENTSAGGNESGLIQFITVQPGKKYDSAAFFARYGTKYKIFDAPFFSKQLANILFSTFTTMLVIIGSGLSLLLFFFYLDLRLTLLTLTPVIFAYICTLGTLRLLGHTLDIPALMLSIIILGMGVDYSIFCVRAHQRYRDIDHPGYGLVRSTVFLAGASTLIGFGVLCFAEHSMLRSIGITSLLGIGYSLLGTFLLLPPLLHRYFNNNGLPKKKGGKGEERTIGQRVCGRYQTLEAYPRMFARFKLQFDPMFKDLPKMLAQAEKTDALIDIGCGYGVPACWCLEYFKNARVYGIDPDPERVRVATIATGRQGKIFRAWAPDLPLIPNPADIVLLLDMLHYLDEEKVQALFRSSRQALASGGILISRFVIRPESKPSWSWRLEDTRIKLSGHTACYRPREEMRMLMEAAGFLIIVDEISAANRELAWIVGRSARE